MSSLRTLLILVLAGTGSLPAFAQKQAPQKQQLRAQRQADSHPGEQILGRLSHMTPEEREKALSAFPPARRAQIEQRIRNFEKLSPAAQTRTLDRLERLNSLPAERQNQVRRSMRDLQQLPPERKTAVQQELGRLGKMPNDERQALMNTEAFRNRYSPEEQRMIGDMAEILPPKE